MREEFEVLNCATCVLALIISFVDSAARIPAGEFSISLSPALVRYRTCCYRPFDLAVPRTARALNSTRSHSTPIIPYTEYIILFYFTYSLSCVTVLNSSDSDPSEPPLSPRTAEQSCVPSFRIYRP